MSEVAYGERDIKTIAQRANLNSLYSRLRKIIRVLFLYKTKTVETISTYPMIEDREDLIELVNKLAWAYPFKGHLTINVYVSEKFTDIDLKQIKEIKNQRNYIQNNTSHIQLVDKFNSISDLIFVTKAKSIFSLNPFYLPKTEILDKEYFSTVEGALLQSEYSRTLGIKEKETIEKLSINNYSRMLEQNKNKNKAYCFVTGPSFDKYKEFTYESNSFKVICNSIVKNDEFLEYIGKPDLLVFADPVFHFSPSEYSAVFRDHVLKVYKKYECFIMVPENTVGLMLSHYPMLKDNIIGINGRNESYNFPTRERFWIKSSANILTLYMLPVASAVSNEINIIGADGRNPEEKYFWQHSSSVQFDDLMKTVFETHPSFFRDRDYKDYYEEHCTFLENLLCYGELKGKKYFSLTKSFIPALLKRKK